MLPLSRSKAGGDDDDEWLEAFWAGNSNPWGDDDDNQPKATPRATGPKSRQAPNQPSPQPAMPDAWTQPPSWDLPQGDVASPWGTARFEDAKEQEWAAAEELHRPGDIIIAAPPAGEAGSLGARPSSPSSSSSRSSSLTSGESLPESSSLSTSSSSSGQRAYRVVRKLGQGGFGSTYEAVEVAADEAGRGEVSPPGERVAVKAVSLKRSRNWKVLELFEREARVLRALSHPGIPSYKDYFEVDTADDRVFYIVQRLARGRSLGQLVRDGWRPNEATVRALALQLLAILDYLETRRPPVVHRDIKPDNIVIDLEVAQRGERETAAARVQGRKKGTAQEAAQMGGRGAVAGAAQGGRETAAAAVGGTAGAVGDQGEDQEPPQIVNLVDFGAVQDMAASTGTRLPSTMIGTFGYVAPEVYQGRGSSRSDQYSIGTSLLFVLSGGAAPSDFPQERLKPKFQGRVVMSAAMERFLDRLLEPAPEDRFRSAREAMDALMGSSISDGAPGAASGATRPGVLGGRAGFGRARQQKDFESRRQQEQLLQQQRASEAYQRLAAATGGGLVGPPDVMLGPRQLVWSEGGIPKPPAGTQVEVTKPDGMLLVDIPARMLSGDTVANGGFAVAWNAFVFFWTQSAILGGAPILFTLFSAPFWVVGLQLARSAFGDAFVKTGVRIDKDNFRIVFSALGGDKEILGRTRDITDARIFTESIVNGEPRTVCEIVEGVNSHRFGGSLTIREKEWVMYEICTFLDSFK